MVRKRSSTGWLERLEVRYLLSTYFVDPAGSDLANGTQSAPWVTLQHAAVTVKAGDSVIVRPGDYAGFVMGWDAPNSGTLNNPIIWHAQPGAVIVTTNNKTADGIDIEHCDYVTLEGFTVRPQINSDGWRSGIRIGGGGTGNVVRSNVVEVRSREKYGIFSSFTTDLLIDHNTVTGSRNSAIYTSNSAVRPTLRYNTVSDAAENGLHFNGDISQGGTGVIDGAVIEGNIISNTGQGGGSAINCDGIENSVIKNNLLFDNHGKGITLYQIDASAPSINNVIVNNTVVMSAGSQYALTIKDASTGNEALNNILINEDAVSGAINISPDSLPGFSSDYNVVTGRFTLTDGDARIDLTEWRSTTGQDAASIGSDVPSVFADPTVSNFHLKSGSPAIDAGTATDAPGIDLESSVRPAGGGYDAGAFEYGATGIAGVPNLPTGLVGVSQRSTEVLLTWIDNANNENGYIIERSTGANPYQTITWLNPNSAQFVDSGLLPNASYGYRVYAANSFGDSNYSNAITLATLPVTAPDNLIALPNSYTSIALTWNDADAGYVTSYNVYRATTDSVPIDAGHRIAGSVMALSFIDATVMPGTQYYYRVTAIGAVSAESTPSDMDGANTVPDAPSDLIVGLNESAKTELEWNVDDSSTLDHFNLYRSSTPDLASAVLLSQTTGFSFIDTSAQANSSYYYHVTQVNIAGVESAASNIVGFDVPPVSPAISNAAVAGGAIQINWSYADLTGIDHFNVYRGDSPVVLLDAAHRIGQTTNLQFTDNNADGMRRWYYAVTAVNSNSVESISSNIAGAQFSTAFAVLDAAGLLTITGTTGDDSISLGVITGHLQFNVNGAAGAYDAAELNFVTVNALAGNDTLQLDNLGSIPISLGAGGGNDSTEIASGMVNLNGDSGLSQQTAIVVDPGATAVFHDTQHLTSLNVADGGRLVLSAGGSWILYLDALDLNSTGILDLNDNGLVVNNGVFTQIQQLTLSGYRDQPDPAATGIISTTSQIGGGNTFLMLFDNALVGVTDWPNGSENTVAPDAIIGRYTYFGDTNLDGQVTAADYNAVDASLGVSGIDPGLSVFYGDTNFDLSVSAADYNAIDARLGVGVGDPLAAAAASTVSRVAAVDPVIFAPIPEAVAAPQPLMASGAWSTFQSGHRDALDEVFLHREEQNDAR